jgi:hypothetical protein
MKGAIERAGSMNHECPRILVVDQEDLARLVYFGLQKVLVPSKHHSGSTFPIFLPLAEETMRKEVESGSHQNVNCL